MRGWLLDTNVVAEIARKKGEARVLAWADEQRESDLLISVLTLGEYEKGIANLPPASPSRARIAADVSILETDYRGRLLQVSERIVRRWGMIMGETKRLHGIVPAVVDTLLAATAIEHGLYLATRNVKDVRFSGARLFNPWEDDPAAFPLMR